MGDYPALPMWVLNVITRILIKGRQTDMCYRERGEGEMKMEQRGIGRCCAAGLEDGRDDTSQGHKNDALEAGKGRLF